MPGIVARERQAARTGGGWECSVLVPSGLVAVAVPAEGYLVPGAGVDNLYLQGRS
jgi:hypothetical protein